MTPPSKGKKDISKKKQNKVVQKKPPQNKVPQKKPPARIAKLQNKIEKKIEQPLKLKPCVVVFFNGKCETFDSVDEARIQRQSLPEGLVKEYKEFTSRRAAMNFTKTYSIGITQEDTKMPHIPDKNIAAITPDNKTNQMKKHSAFFKDISGMKRASNFSGVASGKMSSLGGESSLQKQFLDSISRNARCLNNVLRVFISKFNAENQELPAGLKLPEKQVVVIDVFDQVKKSTYWTHKPKAWVNVFKTAEATDATLFDEECYFLQSFQFRDLDSSKKDEPKFYHYKTSRGGAIQIAIEGLYALVPISWTTSDIMDFVIKIGKNMMLSFAKEGYSAYYPASASSFRNDIDPGTGSYWKTLEAIFNKDNIETVNIEALSEIFCNVTIFDIMAELFQDNETPEHWDDPRLYYAFKNVLGGNE
jgi:hypothetical protein